MPVADAAEIYFIAAMMVLILVMGFAAVFFFVRQYKKEMREKAELMRLKAAEKNVEKAASENGPA